MEENNSEQSTIEKPSINQENVNGGDISRTTITILVLLTLMISIIGTWTVLNEVNNVKLSSKSYQSSAQVVLEIKNPEEQKALSAASGRVIFNVLKS